MAAQPGPYAQPAADQAGPYGPPPGQLPPKKRRLWLKIGLPVGALIVIGLLVIVGVVAFQGSPATAAVGDCFGIKEFKNGETPGKIDCADPAANVKLAVKLDNDSAQCPEGDYDEYSVSGTNSYKLCMMINARQGDCFANLTSGTAGYQRVPCTDPNAELEFIKIVQGNADKESACGGTDALTAIVYSQPASAYCVRKPTSGAHG
jgi:hypothetical protein